MPGGAAVKADGRLGLARVIARPKENRVWIDYALREDQLHRAHMATSLLLSGFGAAPVVQLNGRPVTAKARNENGQTVYVVPLAAAIAASAVPG